MVCFICRQWQRLLVVTAVFLLAALVEPSRAAISDQEVLILNSYHAGYSWTDDMTNGIRETLRKGGYQADPLVEYMDWKRLPFKEYLEELYRVYRYKYAKRKLSVVFVTDNAALEFALRHRQEIFAGARVVFCGINGYSEQMLAGQKDVTGVVEDVDPTGTVDVALRLHPDAKEVLIVFDGTESGQDARNNVARKVLQYGDRVRFRFLDNPLVGEIEAALRELPPGSIALQGTYSRDRNGRTYNIDEVVKLIATASPVPIYGLWEAMCGKGIVGGSLLSGRIQGETAGRLGLRILAGEDVSRIPVIEKTPMIMMFDYRQMQRYGVNADLLPAGSSVINRPFSFYATYKLTIWLVALVICLLVGTVAVLLVNIAARHRVERALRESEVRLSKAQQIARMGSWEWNPASGRIFCSEGISRLLGLSPQQLETITPELLSRFVHPADYGQVKNAMEELLEADLPFTADWRLIRADLSEIIVNGQGAVEVQTDGTRRIFSGTLLDITERKRAEEERAKLELQLLQTQKLESLGVLAGGIAHDFNNILTAIKGNISYARMDLEATHQACVPLARAEKAVKRAADLARQLLVFAKGGDPVKKVVSLRQIVNEVVALALSGTNVRGVFALSANLHVVNADEGQLNQSFHNIIINAVQAMPAGGRLTVSGENVTLPADNSHGLSAGDYVTISFADEGCGIAAEDLQRIFDPYFTNKAEGSGLGLTSAYSIIHKHDGEITVSSTPGRGTTFTIFLPSRGDTFNDQGEMEDQPIDSHGTDAILVMDDDEMIRELAALTLKRLGYAVTTCVNGIEAIALYRSARNEGNPFSLVIMDLTIPGGMGGVETARQLLAFDPEAHLIVSSGYSEDPVMANFTDYGFCASLEKPYRVEDISRILLGVKRESAG